MISTKQKKIPSKFLGVVRKCGKKNLDSNLKFLKLAHNKLLRMNNNRKRKNIEVNAQNPKNMKTAFNKLNREFFNVASYDLANALLGKILVRKLDNGIILKGRVVETECYPGGEDKASATYNNRRTPANEPLYMQSGTAYVYMTYGMYHCFNVSSSEPGGGVLLRALEPLEGIDTMETLRLKKIKQTGKTFKENELCSGPSKLCTSMDIRKDNCNMFDVCEDENMWFETDPKFATDFKIIKTTRIGIDRAGPLWAKKPFRFYIFDNSNVSKTGVEM